MATFNNVKIICYYIVISIIGNFLVNTIQDGREQKGFPTSSSPVTSTNIGISPQNFLTFSFNPFAPLLQNFKAVPSASTKLLNLNQ